MNLQYPIGEYTWPKSITKAMITQWIDDIDSLPNRVETAISGLSDIQLDTRYRPEGWTIRQIVHHLVDSI